MAIDRMAPMMLNLAEGGTTWREHGINRSQVIARNGAHIEQSLPDVWATVLAQLDEAAGAGHVDPGDTVHRPFTEFNGPAAVVGSVPWNRDD